MDIITEDTGIVKVGNKVLPGALQNISVGDEVIIDEIEVEGNKKKAKQIKGYDDATISITFRLTNEHNNTAYDKLSQFQNVFKKPGQTTPAIYDIYNRHLKTRGIGKVVFKKLSTSEGNEMDFIDVTCEFIQFASMQIQVKNTNNSSDSTSKKNTIDKDTPNRKSGKVTARSGLNVRKGAGTNYGIVKTIGYGTRVNIYSTQSEWYKIDGGWVYAKYIKIL